MASQHDTHSDEEEEEEDARELKLGKGADHMQHASFHYTCLHAAAAAH